MGDVAAILGVAARGGGGGGLDFADPFRRRTAPAPAALADVPGGKGKKKKFSREVSALLGDKPQEVLAPLAPSRKIAVGGFKAKAGAKTGKRWAWRPFTSSARRDGLQLSHWVRADAEFTDYPFARFNRRSDIIKYTDQEYAEMLEQDRKAMKREAEVSAELWPKDHTDHLFDLARTYDMRWPLVLDRWEKKPAHNPEDLKRRFFAVTARILRNRRLAPGGGGGGADGGSRGAPPDPRETFEYRHDADKLRRKQLENAFQRAADSIADERRFMKELASVETAIRRVERKLVSGGVRWASGGGGGWSAGGMGGATGATSGGGGADDVVMDQGEGGGGGELYPGSDLIAARNMASKSHPPYVFPAEAGGGEGGGSSSASAPFIAPLKRQAPPSRGQAPVPHLTTPERDPFSMPVSLRSLQMAVPLDGLPADSRGLQKALQASSMLHVPERPIATARVLASINQLRREIIETMATSKEVAVLEQEVYRLEHVRKQAALTGFNAPQKPAMDVKQVAKLLSSVDTGKETDAVARAASNLHPHQRLVNLADARFATLSAAIGGPGVVSLATMAATAAGAQKDSYARSQQRSKAKAAESAAQAAAQAAAAQAAAAQAAAQAVAQVAANATHALALPPPVAPLVEHTARFAGHALAAAGVSGTGSSGVSAPHAAALALSATAPFSASSAGVAPSQPHLLVPIPGLTGSSALPGAPCAVPYPASTPGVRGAGAAVPSPLRREGAQGGTPSSSSAMPASGGGNGGGAGPAATLPAVPILAGLPRMGSASSSAAFPPGGLNPATYARVPGVPGVPVVQPVSAPAPPPLGLPIHAGGMSTGSSQGGVPGGRPVPPLHGLTPLPPLSAASGAVMQHPATSRAVAAPHAPAAAPPPAPLPPVAAVAAAAVDSGRQTRKRKADPVDTAAAKKGKLE